MSRKIPGFLPPLPKTEIDGKVENLNQKTKIELLEILERQNKIIANKFFVKKLPDKGEKIISFRNRVMKEIALRDDVDESCNILSHLKISPNGDSNKTFIDNIEWERSKDKLVSVECLDSDDDSEPEDPLAIIASSTDMKKKIIVLKEDEPLIKPEDIAEIKSFNEDNGYEVHSCEQFCQHVMEKTVDRPKLKGKNFKPYKTTVSNVHDPSKEMKRKKGEHWENTSATPPPSIHGPVQEIPLQESFRLQDIQRQKIKEIQVKHAAEKLAVQLGRSIGDLPILLSSSGGKYREIVDIDSDNSNDSSDNELSDKEIHDEEPTDGGVVFTVMS